MSAIAITELLTTNISPDSAIAIGNLCPVKTASLSESESCLNRLTNSALAGIHAGFQGAHIKTLPRERLGSPYPSTE